MELGEQIAVLREERNLSQAELAEKARISPSTLSQIESGKVPRPHVGTVRKIARALDIEPADLRRIREPSLPKGDRAVEEPDRRRELPLIEDPRIAGWFQERGAILGTMSDQEFLEYGRGLDPEELDDDGNPVDVIRAHEALAREAAATRKLLWTPKEYVSLGKLLAVDPNEPMTEQKWQRREQLRKLRRELEKQYHRRSLALSSYANALAAEQEAAGRGPGYFVPAVSAKAAIARREEMRKAAFEGQEAG